MPLSTALTRAKRKRVSEATLSDHGLAKGLKARLTKRRKLASKGSRHPRDTFAPSKSQKRQLESLDALPWKRISSRHFPEAGGSEEDGGMLELDEVSDVEVVYEETEGGKVARFRVCFVDICYYTGFWLIVVRGWDVSGA